MKTSITLFDDLGTAAWALHMMGHEVYSTSPVAQANCAYDPSLMLLDDEAVELDWLLAAPNVSERGATDELDQVLTLIEHVHRPERVLLDLTRGMGAPSRVEDIEAVAHALVDMGYDGTSYRVMDAADHGSGVARKRLVLVAMRGRTPNWPKKRRVTLARALGWSPADAWRRATTVGDPGWIFDRPAPTLSRQATPGVVQHGGVGVKLTRAEQLALQGLPDSWSTISAQVTSEWDLISAATPASLYLAVLAANND